MFIKAIPKIDRNTGKAYNYNRLCETYRLGDKVRHRNILSLDNLIELSDNKDFKFLADRIEQLVGGCLGVQTPTLDSKIRVTRKTNMKNGWH